MDETAQLKARIDKLEVIIHAMALSDKFIFNKPLRIWDGANISLGAISGTKIGTTTNDKLAFYNSTPIIQQTTSVGSASLVGGAGTNITDTDTFDGYTIKKFVRALRNLGLLA